MTSSTFDTIREGCPCFRVLISGKTGVGKTTLIQRTFNIGTLEGSDKERGECNIEEEIRSSENELFVLHDSKGFEPGEVENFEKVKTFIEKRAREPLIKDRLHAVWLCIQIPANQGRLLEDGDEKFLSLSFGDIPVTIVFTKYDLLYTQLFYDHAKELARMPSTEREKLIKLKTTEYFQKNCIEEINKIENPPKNLKTVWVSTSTDDPQYHDTLVGLIDVTLEQLRNVHGSDQSAWIVSAAAQRVNADANITACIEIGIRKYWRDLAVGVHFANKRLHDCIDVIHGDIVAVWNFRDENHILQNSDFKEAVCGLVDDLADPHGQGPNAEKIKAQQNIKATLAAATPIGGPIGFFLKWFFEKYTRNPGVLRCLMGYIVDITIVLEIIFWRKVAQPQPPSIRREDIDAALKLYQASAPHFDIHRQIRYYVDKMKPQDHLNQDDKVHVEIERLINTNRRALPLDTIFSELRTGNTGSPTPGSSLPTADSPANSKQPEVQPKTQASAPATPGKKKKIPGFFKLFRRTQGSGQGDRLLDSS